MYSYIKGLVTEIGSNYIVIDVNGVGYLIYTPNPYMFNENEEYKIYCYQQVREDELSLFGFKTKEEKDLFLKLINVKGLGCKMALPIIASGSIDGIMDAIERENILYLKKFPKIGEKVARQIILDLKGTFKIENKINKEYSKELIEALECLGYKKNDITKILPNIDQTKKIEDQIKDSLKLLLK